MRDFGGIASLHKCETKKNFFNCETDMTSSIAVREYAGSMREEWDAFVESSNNGTMFHKQAFLDYHAAGKFAFHHLMFYANDRLIAVLPGGLAQNGRDFWSPVGASYGSLVTGDIPFEQSLEVVDALLSYARECQWNNLYLIPPPLIYSHKYSQHTEYSMLYRKFGFELHYISHAVELKYRDDFLRHFDKTARKTIRKVLREQHIRICESDDYDTFYKILLANKARHNATPTHSLEDLKRLRQLMPEKLKLYLVYEGDTPIAGSLLFLCNAKVVLCFYNMLLYEYEHRKPIYLIMHETIRWASHSGYTWVDIGVSQVPQATDPMTPSLSLINFKERFNARGILRSTYHKQLNQ